MEAMSKAGGFTIDAKKKSVLLISGGMKNPELVKMNLEAVWEKGDPIHNISLQNGDIIYVPATVIANVSRYFDYLSRIISPLVNLESGYYMGQQIESGAP